MKWLVVALLSAGCLSRAELGRERGDAGASDAGIEHGPDLADFAAELVDGPWRGTATAQGAEPVRIELAFTREGKYVARCIDDASSSCAPFPAGLVENGAEGEYVLTDRTQNGEVWGLTRDGFRDGMTYEGLLDHMQIEADQLMFSRRQRLGIFVLGPSELVLTRGR